MLFFGWGKKSQDWPVKYSIQRVRAEWSYFYLVIFFLSFDTKWFILGDKRSDDRKVTYEEVLQRFPNETFKISWWSRRSLLLLIVLLFAFAAFDDWSKQSPGRKDTTAKTILPATNHDPIKPEDFAKTYSLFDRFYCANSKWPSSQAEILNFSKQTAEDKLLSKFKILKLEASREVQLNILYTPDQASAALEFPMTFIAGFCNTKLPTRTIGLAAGAITLPIPTGFKSLNTSQIEVRYGNISPLPDYVFLDSNTDALISVYFSDSPVKMETKADQNSLRNVMKKAYQDSSVGVAWELAEVKTISSAPAIHLKFESDSSLGRQTNNMYYVLFKGRLVQVSLSVPAKNYDQVNNRFADTISKLNILK